MKKYLYLFLFCLFTNSLSSYNLNLPVENSTWREFLFVKSREKKNPTFLQIGLESRLHNSQNNVFLSFQQDLDKLYFKLFLPFGQFSYFNGDGELIKNFVSDDIGVICGYKVVKNKSTDLSFNLGFTVPTSSGLRQKGDLGLGLDLSKKLWGDRLRFDIIANYRYLFGYSESVDFDMSGCSLFDILFNMSFKIKKAVFDVGCDCLFFEKEKRTLRSDARLFNWLGKKRNIADEEDAFTQIQPITDYELDLRFFDGPYRVYNYYLMYVGLGIIVKQVMIGIGLSYNVAGNITTRRASTVWAKLGFVF